MSEFGKPQPCRNSCGASIYFDRDSPVGHPSENKWVPLEYVNGIKTDQPHNCPNRKQETSKPIGTSQAQPTQEMSRLEEEVIELMSLLTSKLQILIESTHRQKSLVLSNGEIHVFTFTRIQKTILNIYGHGH